MLGGGGRVCFWPLPISVGGGVGAAKSLLPNFLVPKGNQPTACTLALWWLKFAPTECRSKGRGGGGGDMRQRRREHIGRRTSPRPPTGDAGTERDLRG